MTEYNRLFYLNTLFHPNTFRLGLFRAIFDAWFAQREFLTELSSPFSAAYFSFATNFQYLNFVRFRSYSELRFSYGCSLQWWISFVDIVFHLRQIRKQTMGNNKKTALILSSESVYMLIRGVVAAMRVVRNHSKSTAIVFVSYL